MKGRVEAIQYEARLMLQTDGSELAVDGKGITVSAANSATLYLSGATNFKNYRDVTADPVKRNDEYLCQGRRSDPMPSWQPATSQTIRLCSIA